MLKVGMVVRLRNSDDYRNTYAVIDEINKIDNSCSVVIYDKDGDEYDSVAWLDEGEDFIVCPQYNVYDMPKNLDYNFIALDMADFGCAEGFEDVSLQEHEDYLNSLLNDKEYMDSLIEDYDIDWIENFKNSIVASKEVVDDDDDDEFDNGFNGWFDEDEYEDIGTMFEDYDDEEV